MDPDAYRGMHSFTRDLSPQVPVNEQSQEQALDEQGQLPSSHWTVYSMDVRIFGIIHVYAIHIERLRCRNLC